MQVLGHKEGLDVMERADPLFLLIGLPTIPLMLTLSKMIRWEDYVLKLWRKHSPKLPFWSKLFPDMVSVPAVPRIPADTAPISDPISATRVLCGALIFPTIATMCGKFMFGSLNSNLQRTILVSISKGPAIMENGIQKCYSFVSKMYLINTLSQIYSRMLHTHNIDLISFFLLGILACVLFFFFFFLKKRWTSGLFILFISHTCV